MSILTAIILVIVALGAGWALGTMHQERKQLRERVAKLEDAKQASERCKLSFQKAESMEELTALHLQLQQELEVIGLHMGQLKQRTDKAYEMGRALRDNKHQK